MNTKNSKRILSALMAAIMLLMTLPVSTFVNAGVWSIA